MRLASCACGQLQARCEGEPSKVSLCYCNQCQMRTGGPFGVAVFFQREAVTATGQAATHTRVADSGHEVTFHFCAACGSNVLWEPARKPESIGVAWGAFADPAFPAPRQAVNLEGKPDWVDLRLA